MIIRDTAIPLQVYPYSTTSCVVRWLTRHHGKISTTLKGAYRAKSPFLGEYELFGTSELLFYAKRSQSLYTAKETALLHPRAAFRHHWKSFSCASYISALFDRTTPEETPLPEHFEHFEELLDLAAIHGNHPHFILWAEAYFCAIQGHSPNLKSCPHCSATTQLAFCAKQGGVVCLPCAKKQKLPILPAPLDTLSILRSWSPSPHPTRILNTRLTPRQHSEISTISATFMNEQFNLNPQLRLAATTHQTAKLSD